MTTKPAVFTIVARNYLPFARTLMDSVAQYHPECARYVFLVDEIGDAFDPAAENFEVILSRDLAIPQSPWFHFKYSILELSTAIKPYALEYVIASRGHDRVLYLDPDIRVYSSLSRLFERLERANIVLTPHLLAPHEDGLRPSDLEILQSGSYNLGFIGVAASAETQRFLRWWQTKLYDQCVVDIPKGLFVDQRWCDLVPGLYDGVVIERDPGYNVAYWNVAHREVRVKNGEAMVNSGPLYFFHFSGYHPDQPDQLSKHQNRHRLRDLPGVAALADQYRAELIERGFGKLNRWPLKYSHFDNGLAIPELARGLFKEAFEGNQVHADPYSYEGFAQLMAFCNRPADGARPETWGVTKMAHHIYRLRTDVQAVMPDIFGGDYERFLRWMLSSAVREHQLLEPLVQGVRQAVAEMDGAR